MSEFTCTACQCERADWDVAIDVLDGKPLPRKFQRAYCKACGKSHVSDRKGFCVLSGDFNWEALSGDSKA